jgi:hypothetical protein
VESIHEQVAVHREPYGQMVYPRLPTVTTKLPEEYAQPMAVPALYAFEFVNTNLLFAVQLDMAIVVDDDTRE